MVTTNNKMNYLHLIKGLGHLALGKSSNIKTIQAQPYKHLTKEDLREHSTVVDKTQNLH